jgi:[amino group carrier protein]-L-2-aminoadipate 6-kinase
MNPSGPIIVFKIGGSVIDGTDPSLVDDMKDLINGGSRPVLVHGGGDQVTEIAEKLGKPQRFITSPGGIRSRFTDKDTAEIYAMVMSGLLSKKIVRALSEKGLKSLSLTGADCGLLRAERKKRLVILDERGRKVAIEGGYTGKITSVNTAFLQELLDSSIVPVISPVASDSSNWDLLNVDGDRACSHVAGALKADAAVFLTDTDGLVIEGKVIQKITTSEARSLLPKIGPGMDKKVIAAMEAVEMGAKSSIISSGLKIEPLKNALAEKGTVISAF